MGTRTYREWRAGSSAAGDQAISEYNSVNAQVYENGTLGPRPGWKEFTDSAGTRVFDPSVDALQGLTWYLRTNDAPYLVAVFSDAGTKKYDTLDLTNGDWEAGGTLTGLTVAEFDAGNLNKANYDDRPKVPVSNDGNQLTTLGGYVTVSNASSIGTPVSPNTGDGYPSGVTLYRERAYYWAIANKPGRIYYSFPANYANWDDGTANGNATWTASTGFFDVNADVSSYAGAPIGLWSIKNALLIATKDNRWMVLTGPSPENGTLRELGKDIAPNPATAVTVDNELYFLNPTAKGVVVATPAFVETKSLEYLSPTAYPGATNTRPDPTFQPLVGVGDEVSRGIFLPGRNISDAPEILAVERVNDTWTLSLWDYDTAVPEDVLFTRGRTGELWAMVQEAADWVPYSRDFTLNRPAKNNDSLSVPLGSEAGVTAGSEVVVELGETEAGDGKIVRPVKVVLDIDYWKGGQYSAPELAIAAKIHGTEASVSEDTLATQTITTTGWGDTTGNVPSHRRVAVALPQGQFGTRFDVTITFDNLALDTVQVYYEEQTDPR